MRGDASNWGYIFVAEKRFKTASTRFWSRVGARFPPQKTEIARV